MIPLKWTHLVALCTLLTGVAQAQDAEDIFSRLDKNSDGILVADEVPEAQRRFFERLVRTSDENEDGKLSQAEYQASLKDESRPSESQTDRAPRFQGRFGDANRGGRGMGMGLLSRFDKNKDGKIEKSEVPEEFQERMQPLFDRFMTDTINVEQLQQYGGTFRSRSADDINRGRPEMRRDREGGEAREGDNRPEGPRSSRMDRFGDRPRYSDRGEGRPQGGRPESPFRGPRLEFVRVLDRDENGKISKEEALYVAKLFEELDRNDDGELDSMELMGFRGGPPEFMRGGDGQRPRFGEGRPEGDRPEFGRRRFEGQGRPERDDMRDGDRPEPRRFGRRDSNRPERPEMDETAPEAKSEEKPASEDSE